MDIQRVGLLLLAGAFAAPACVTTVDDNSAGGSGGSSGSSTGGAKTGTGGKSGGAGTGGATTGGNPSTGGSSGADGSVGGSDASTGGADGSAGSDGSKGDARTDAPIIDAAVSVDVNRPDSGGCDDNTMLPGGYGDCTTLQADGCAYANMQVRECTGVKSTMKAFLAQQTIQCMLDNAACDPLIIYGCKKKILTFACPDSSADDECATIHTNCSAASVDLCKQYLSGMTQTGRNKMVSCMNQFCSLGFDNCIESL